MRLSVWESHLYQRLAKPGDLFDLETCLSRILVCWGYLSIWETHLDFIISQLRFLVLQCVLGQTNMGRFGQLGGKQRQLEMPIINSRSENKSEKRENLNSSARIWLLIRHTIFMYVGCSAVEVGHTIAQCCEYECE